MRWLVAPLVVVCSAGCGQLLGIDDPKPAAGDIDAGTDGTDGPPIDSSPPCVTAASFGPEESFSVGATGVRFVVAALDNRQGRDVAIAVGNGVQIMSGSTSSPGTFSLGAKIVTSVVTQVDGLLSDDFDADGDSDLIVWDDGGSTVAAIRQDSSVMPTGFLAEQALTGPFAGIQGALAGPIDSQPLADLIVKDELAARPFTSNLGTPISFKRETTTIGNVDANDVPVALGQLDGSGGYDVAFLGAGGEVRIAFGAPTFSAATVVASGARGRSVGFGKLDEDGSLDLIVGTAAGGVIYRGRGGTFAPASGTIAAVTGPTMQVIDLNGDQKDDLVLATRIVYQCAPATTGEAGVFSQFEDLGDGGPLVAVDVTGDQKPDLLRINGTELKVRVHR